MPFFILFVFNAKIINAFYVSLLIIYKMGDAYNVQRNAYNALILIDVIFAQTLLLLSKETVFIVWLYIVIAYIAIKLTVKHAIEGIIWQIFHVCLVNLLLKGAPPVLTLIIAINAPWTIS